MQRSALRKRILILAAQPRNLQPLRLGEEVKKIKTEILLSKGRDRFQVEAQLAVTADEFRHFILEFKPHIVHFCGHGLRDGLLALEDEAGRVQGVETEALADLFKHLNEEKAADAIAIECVVLSACHSEPQARAIAPFVACAIGMEGEICDRAAIAFARGFYDALAAGKSYNAAYHLGRTTIRMARLADHTTPMMVASPVPILRTPAAPSSSAPQPQPLGLPPLFRSRARALSVMLLLAGVLAVWLCRPALSRHYNRRGLDAYRARNFKQATAHYKRAIALQPDNGNAHYNLALIYEDREDLPAAKQAYQQAVNADVIRAHNNLARLYLREDNATAAANLLAQGLRLSLNQSIYPEDRYNLYKNLGWAHLQQQRHKPAQAALETAIAIASDPEVAQYLPNLASAHCLLAQVLERQQVPPQSSQALTHWQQCRDLGNGATPEEKDWLYLAEKRLQTQGTHR